MSRKAEALVWDRSRAKGSDLLVLLCIADCTNEEGRFAWPSVQRLAVLTRMSERGAQYVLHRLERRGEILVDWNNEGRKVEHKGREFTPMWFLHVRCVCEWEAYQVEGKTANFAGSAFKAGRRPSDRKPGSRKPQTLRVVAEGKPENFSEESEQSRTGNPQDPAAHIRKDPSVRDPSVERAHAPRAGHRRHVFCPPDKSGGFCVPEFLHRELETMLGSHAGAFDLLGWYISTDTRRRDEQPTVLDGLGWWREQLRAEIRRQGWAPPKVGGPGAARAASQAPAYREPWACPHDPRCPHPAACAVVSQRRVG